MEFHNLTKVTQEVNDDIDSFKYQKGRVLNIVIASLFLAAGLSVTWINTLAMSLGLVVAVMALLFIYSFTLGWKKTLGNIIASNTAKHPLKESFTLSYVFKEEELEVSLIRQDGSHNDSHYPYSQFNGLKITERYLYLLYGDPTKNPPLPVKKEKGQEQLVAFLQKKIQSKKNR
jgi:hypothetical protein